MLLGRKKFSKSEQRRFVVEYDDYLCNGNLLVTATVTVPAGTTTTVGTPALAADKKSFTFFLTSGAVNEAFTATVQVTLSNTEVLTDTAEFVVS